MRMNINPHFRRSKPFRLIYRCLLALLVVGMTSAGTAPPRVRTVQFGYKTIVKAIPAGTHQADIWIPVPHNSPYQRISNLTITSPYPYRLDAGQNGNRVLHLRLKEPPKASVVVDMQFKASRQEHSQPGVQTAGPVQSSAPEPDLARWLKADRLVPLDDTIKRWARQVVDSVGAKTDLERARAIYNHVIATVKYDKTGTGWGRGDIYYACDARRGNCTDFHAIFIGYCRALGIPARFAIGFSLPTDRPAGEVKGYHCWAEFYSQGIGWVPIDASEAAKNPARRTYFFGAHDENRVEFSRGRDLLFHPRQKEPLNYFVYPYAEADGDVLTTVETQITYRDVVN